MTTPQSNDTPPVRPSDVVAGQSNTGDFNTDFAGLTTVETPAENCVSVVPLSDADINTTPDQHKRAGGGLLGSAPRETVASVVSAGQSHHSLDTDSESVVDAARTFFAAQKAAETDAQQVRAKKRSRIFSVMQYAAHPTTGEVMYCETLLQEGLARRSIRRWAWILHDRDANADGTPKGAHWHLVLECEDAYSIRQISDWFSVPSARVMVPKESGLDYAGRGARERTFFDLVRYLVHENGDPLGSKARYAREEVKSNDAAIWEALDAHMAKRRSRSAGGRMTAVDELAMAIQEEGLTLRQARARDPLSFNRAESRMRASRGTYLQMQEAPEAVLNIYVYGEGGVGKDLLAKALARALAPEAERPYFKPGGDNVVWEHYDGEPVIIWEEMRVGDMIRAAKSRGMLFRILGPWREPDEAPVVNVKGARTKLVNRVNIITGPEEYDQFLRGLAGEYESMQGGIRVRHEAENVAQGYRRFPLIIPVAEGEFSIFVNLGVLRGTREYESYEKYEHFRQNLQGIAERAKAVSDRNRALQVRHEIEQRTVVPIVAQAKRITDQDQKPVDAEVVLNEFSAVGSQITEAEIIAAEVKKWRAQAEAGRAEWEAKWARAKATPPPGVYDKWLDDYVAWAAKNGGVAEARRRMISGEGPLPPELVQPPESTRYESPRQSGPGISFDL